MDLQGFPSSALISSYAPLVNYEVKVTNTGTVDADDVVLGFLVPPGAGVNGVPLQTLFGFERVHVPASGKRPPPPKSNHLNLLEDADAVVRGRAFRLRLLWTAGTCLLILC